MKYAVALPIFASALCAQTLYVPAIDDHGQTALVGSDVLSDGQLGVSSLYLLDTGGAGMRTLTNVAATWVDLSSDGSRVAYTLNTSSPPGTEIHVVDTTSGADRKVAFYGAACEFPVEAARTPKPRAVGPFYTCVESVHFSPDASQVVYAIDDGQVYVVNADGSGTPRVLSRVAGLASSPTRVVSRNGLLVFTYGDVYVANLDGSGTQNLTNFPAGTSAGYATISEDGGTIAFGMAPVFTNEQTTNAQIYILHPGGAPQQLTTYPLYAADRFNPAGALLASLSADGSLAAYVDVTYIRRETLY